jgi:hypothetical protein
MATIDPREYGLPVWHIVSKDDVAVFGAGFADGEAAVAAWAPHSPLPTCLPTQGYVYRAGFRHAVRAAFV